MAVPVGKMVPTVIVAAVVAYCCWPHWVGSDGAAGKKKAALPEIAAAVLSPTASPDPPRNLFGPDGVVAAAEKPKPKPAVKPRPQVTEDPAKMLSGLSLKAIWIRGASKSALINGRLYTTGDTLETATNPKNGTNPKEAALKKPEKPATGEKDPGESFIVSRILSDKVLLTRGDLTLELTFADKPDAKHSSPPPPSRAGKAESKTGR